MAEDKRQKTEPRKFNGSGALDSRDGLAAIALSLGHCTERPQKERPEKNQFALKSPGDVLRLSGVIGRTFN
jgi:hypothetical protein